MRQYNNPISFSDMLGESAFSLDPWLNSECAKQPGTGISLMTCDRFFVRFQATIGIDVPVSMSEYFFLSSFLYNRRCCGTLPSLLLKSIDTPYNGFLTLLDFLFSRRDFFLFPFFFGIDLCGPTLLGFSVGRRTTFVKITLSSRSVLLSAWLRARWNWN